jgi:DNA-binding response OmpR family regulator
MEDLKRILIVEDSETMVSHIKIMLQGRNIKLTHVGSEFGVFSSIESYGKTADLLLLDINLKSENGLDILEKIRSVENYSDIPVIVISESVNVDFILKAKELKVASYLKKPFNKETFLDRIDEVFK